MAAFLKYYLPAVSFLISAALVTVRNRPGCCRIINAARSQYIRLASRRLLACAAVAVLILGSRIVLLPLWPKPVPRIYDEFSYLLMADTFAHGRLTNASPAHWEHFEAPFVQLWPTYQSVYPIAPGVILAAGESLFGHPWWAVWLAAGLLGSAICWMAQGWLPPPWALAGGVLAALQFGISSYWMNSYWGGTSAAIGGALLLGAWPRFGRRPSGVMGAILTCGLLLLANSRPWEGLLMSVLVLAMLVRDLRRRVGKLPWRTLAPAAAVLTIGAVFMAYYFRQVTGSPFRTPYQVAFSQYAAGGIFFWQPLKSTLYRHAELEQFYKGMAAYGRAQYSSFGGLLVASLAKLYVIAHFFVGPLVFIVIAALPLLIRNRRTRRLLICLAAVVVANFATTFLQVHYAAPAAGALVVLSCSSLRCFWLMRRRGWRIGTYLVPAIWTLLALSFIAELPYAIAQPAPPPRDRLESALERTAQKHLVFVRYGANHQATEDEWVYNQADLTASRVIWARDMGPERNRNLIRDYPDHRIWLVEPDKNTSELIEYTF